MMKTGVIYKATNLINNKVSAKQREAKKRCMMLHLVQEGAA